MFRHMSLPRAQAVHLPSHTAGTRHLLLSLPFRRLSCSLRTSAGPPTPEALTPTHLQNTLGQRSAPTKRHDPVPTAPPVATCHCNPARHSSATHRRPPTERDVVSPESSEMENPQPSDSAPLRPLLPKTTAEGGSTTGPGRGGIKAPRSRMRQRGWAGGRG